MDPFLVDQVVGDSESFGKGGAVPGADSDTHVVPFKEEDVVAVGLLAGAMGDGRPGLGNDDGSVGGRVVGADIAGVTVVKMPGEE